VGAGQYVFILPFSYKKIEVTMIFSIDQSTNISGWVSRGSNKEILDFGIIDLSNLPKQTDQDQADKRHELIQQVSCLVFKYKIKLVITEGIYGGKLNLDNFKKLAQCQGCLQDWCRNNERVCFSFANAGEWRAIIGTNGKNRDEDKELTKRYVLEHYDIQYDVEKIIFDKYHTEKHKCFNDLSKEVQKIQFDFYDAIAMSDAYFKMIDSLGEACE
jgi:Holliday junction resolvasome RuvABC endonuclease subunit